MEITPLIPDGFEGVIKRQLCPREPIYEQGLPVPAHPAGHSGRYEWERRLLWHGCHGVVLQFERIGSGSIGTAIRPGKRRSCRFSRTSKCSTIGSVAIRPWAVSAQLPMNNSTVEVLPSADCLCWMAFLIRSTNMSAFLKNRSLLPVLPANCMLKCRLKQASNEIYHYDQYNQCQPDAKDLE